MFEALGDLFGRTVDKPDLGPELDIVSAKIRRSVLAVSKLLKKHGIPHALVGGIAAGAYSQPRTTKDVDFMVHSSARKYVDDVMCKLRLPLPKSTKGIVIDVMTPMKYNVPRDAIDCAITGARESKGVPVMPIEALFLLKLRRFYERDRAHVVDMINAGVNLGSIVEYLKRHAPDLVERFVAMKKVASREKAGLEAEYGGSHA